MSAILWQYIDRDDPHNSGWWQMVRLTRWDDGTVELEVDTRGSVVPITIKLPPDTVQALWEALQ